MVVQMIWKKKKKKKAMYIVSKETLKVLVQMNVG